MQRFRIESLQDGAPGFGVLAELAAAGEEASRSKEVLSVDLRQARFLSGPMVASLGATIQALRRSGQRVKVLLPLTGQVGAYLGRNGFAEKFGGTAREDRYGTSIPFSELAVDDTAGTEAYIARQVLDRPELAGLAPGLTQKIENVLWETRENAREHGASSHVFIAGQRFPQARKLELQMADIGVGFRRHINRTLRNDWSAARCLEWALSPRATTRRHGPPGGLGLKVLRRFLQQNRGSLVIASDAAVWQEDREGVHVYRLRNALIATSVSITVCLTPEALRINYFDESDEEGVVF